MTIWHSWVRYPQRLFLRKALFQIHLWTGIAAGVYVFAICLSGSIVVYRNELYRYFSPTRGRPLPAGFRATAWLLDFHDNLLSGTTGRSINGVGALLVLVLCLTGAVIWWPGIKSWRRSLTVDVRADWMRISWRLHSALGFWCFAFILLWGITGAYLSFPDKFAAFFDYVEPLDANNPADRMGDTIQYWLAYLHFGRLGGRIPGCSRGLCDSTTKLIWAVFGLVPPAMFVTGFLMWWTRVVRPARRLKNAPVETAVENLTRLA